MTDFPTVRVAGVQATPVILDASASVEKAIRLLEEAAGHGAQLVVLPETFVPLYPSNAWAKGASGFGGWDELWERLWEESVDVPGPLVAELEAACARLGVEPPQAAFLDDIGLNLKAARALGMTTINVTSLPEALAELSKVTGGALV